MAGLYNGRLVQWPACTMYIGGEWCEIMLVLSFDLNASRPSFVLFQTFQLLAINNTLSIKFNYRI